MRILGFIPSRIWWVVTIPSGVLAMVVLFYAIQFGPHLSEKQETWGQFGDFIGGITNPIISIIGLIAVIGTLQANLAAINDAKRHIQAQLFAQSESHFVDLEKLLSQVPTALRFHGIDTQELAEAGITVQDLSYLLANFTAGGINVRALRESDTSPFEDGTYYRTMLEASDTRKAWPFITKMMSDSPYKQRIESTISLIERLEAGNAARGDA